MFSMIMLQIFRLLFHFYLCNNAQVPTVYETVNINSPAWLV
uniref:Uncharacterized protein n=1 Tax=Arundo donax TaxID=35708 RepID=A0A0A9ERS7_ARUDO